MPTPNIVRTLRQSPPLQLAVLLIGGALLSSEAAWLHMREFVQTYGVICGAGSSVAAHCPACYASVSLLVAAAALLLAHADSQPALLRARSNPSA